VILCKKGKAEEALLNLRQIMGKLKLTVNEEKTRICKVPEGEFDFLGFYVWADVLSNDWSGSYGHEAIEEEYPAHGRKDSCNDRPQDGMARDHGVGGQVEPHVARLGELLPGRKRQPSIPSNRQLHRDAVAPVATQQVQAQTSHGRDLSIPASLRVLRSRTSERTWGRSLACVKA
jgi:hypothetical protein